MTGRQRGVVIGTIIAVLGLAAGALPSAAALEDSTGLRLLFFVRGARPAPSGVAVVSIDEVASANLNLPSPLPRDWRRSIHATLIDRLVQRGASVIAFDLQFFRSSEDPQDDQTLSEAIARSGRTVLVQRVDLARIDGEAFVFETQNPSGPLADAAAALAPAVLPASTVTSWYWPTIETPGGEAVSTLPGVAMRVQAARGGHEPRDASAARGVAPGARVYLNFYGPPGTICTVPYDQIIRDEPTPCPMRNAAVFVGIGHSRVVRADQPDTYVTPVSMGSVEPFSGVEIHATAFANLADGSALAGDSIAGPIAVVLLGAAAGVSAYVLRTRRRRTPAAARLMAAAAAAGIGVLYTLAAIAAFSQAHVVLPTVVPLAIQVPAAMILALMVRPAVTREQVEAVCLTTDASGSTALGQRLSHDAYADLMRRYHETLVTPVRRHGGDALPPQGDGFVALWPIRDDASRAALQRAATSAALDVLRATEQFNGGQPEDQQLATRVGLSIGPVTLVADADRGLVEAFGDAINVAARLRDLNVRLGTSVLATYAVTDGVSGVPVTDVPGDWALKGVARPPRIVALETIAQAGGTVAGKESRHDA
jgi:adenylate cyclase